MQKLLECAEILQEKSSNKGDIFLFPQNSGSLKVSKNFTELKSCKIFFFFLVEIVSAEYPVKQRMYVLSWLVAIYIFEEIPPLRKTIVDVFWIFAGIIKSWIFLSGLKKLGLEYPVY